MIVIHKSLKIVVIFFMSIFAFTLWADDGIYESTPPSLFFQYAHGEGDTDNFLLALGLSQPDQKGNFGGLYVNQFSFSKGQKVTGIGILAFNLISTADSVYGARVHLGISKTDLVGYKRTGLEIGGDIHFFISNTLSWYVGTTLRPTFLSVDWGNDELSEINYLAGIHYQPVSSVSVFAQYNYDGFLSEKLRTSDINDGVQIGFSWLY